MTERRHDRRPLVAVTGGAGFIGSHTVDLLIARGCQVVVLDDFSTGKRANLSRWSGSDDLEIVEVDVSDGLFAPLADVTRRRGPVERVIHLAAQTAVARSIDNPLFDARVNYLGTLRVLEYARATDVRHVVLASSAAVYGDGPELPVSENAPTEPVSPYGIHKRVSEMSLHYAAAIHGLSTTALRFFNVYGPRQDPSSPYSGVISIFADRAMAGAPITIFGDGEQTRDFIFVSDLARAICTVCASDRTGYAVANLGTGVETTINRLASLVLELCRSRSDIMHGPARPGDIVRSVAATDRARELLSHATGGDYQVSGVELRDGLAQTLEWIRGCG